MRSQRASSSSNTNNLFPVFLKLENLRVLVVGGGKVAVEKVRALLQNSPATSITVVAPEFLPELISVSKRNKNVSLRRKKFSEDDLKQIDLVLSAVNNLRAATKIRHAARRKRILVNAADKPSLCDFYLGSVVKKGNLKIAISTNGKSPTMAKRLKEVLNGALPEEVDHLLHNLEKIRNQLKGNMALKIRRLNKITSLLASDPKEGSTVRKSKRITAPE